MDNDPNNRHIQSDTLKKQYEAEPEKLEKDQTGNNEQIKIFEKVLEEKKVKVLLQIRMNQSKMILIYFYSFFVTPQY